MLKAIPLDECLRGLILATFSRNHLNGDSARRIPCGAPLALPLLTVLCLACSGKKDDPPAMASLSVTAAGPCSRELLLSEVSKVDILEHLFTLTSRSEGPTCITLNRVSCGCLEIRRPNAGAALKAGDEFLLGPAESQEVAIRLRVAPRPEVQARSIEFIAQQDAGKPERLELGVSVNVLPDISISPPVITYRGPRPGAGSVKRAMKMQCASRGDAPQRVKPRIVASPSEIKLVAVEAGDCRRVGARLWVESWDVTLSVEAPRAGQNEVYDTVVMAVGESPASTLRIPVSIRRACGVYATPNSVNFGAVSRGEQLERRILLLSGDDRIFDVVSVESDVAEVSATVASAAANKRQWVLFRFAPTKAGTFCGQAIVRTTHPDASEVTVEVLGVCR